MPDPANPAYPAIAAARERAEASMGHLRRVLGGKTTVDNVGELASLMADLPPATPLWIDDRVVADPSLQPGDSEVFAVVASPAWVTNPDAAPIHDGRGMETVEVTAALQLSLCVLPAPDAPAPADPVPYWPDDVWARLIDPHNADLRRSLY